MDGYSKEPRALFLADNGSAYPDTLICSGILPPELDGSFCPFSDNGRLPLPQPLRSDSSDYTIDQGQPGNLCPPCVKQQLGKLSHWQGHRGQRFPEELLPLRLFKCKQWFWLVVPNLHDASPTSLQQEV